MAKNSKKDYISSKGEQELIANSIAFKGKSLRVRDISRIRGTSVYSFHYRSATANDVYPLVMLVGRALGGPYFRYPKTPNSRAKGDTYLAAINLSDLSDGEKKYLLTNYGSQPYITTGEAHKLSFLKIVYRIYDTRKLRALQPVDAVKYLNSL